MFDKPTIASIISGLSSVVNDRGEEMIWRIVELVKRRAGFAFVGLYMIDPQGKFALLKSGTDSYGRKLVGHGHKVLLRLSFPASSVERTISLNKVFLIDYSLHYSGSPLLPFSEWELSFPLRRNGKAFGAIEVEGGEKLSFDINETLEFQKVADEVSNLLIVSGIISS